MDAHHLHLLLNHFPIIGTMFGFFAMLIGLITKNKTLHISSLVIFIAVAIIAIPTFVSGDGAEEKVKDSPTISKELIEEHESAAKIAFPFALGLGIISLVVLIFGLKNDNFFKIGCYVVFIVSIITFGMMAYTGNTGGNIRINERIKSIQFKIETEDEKGD